MNKTEHELIARYLLELERRLAPLPADQRAAICDDVRAHLEDAAEAGRPIAEVIAALGPAHVVAAEYLREFGIAADELPGRRTQTRLLLAAAVVGAVTAVFTAFLFPVFASRTTVTGEDGSVVETADEALTVAQFAGPVAALLLLIPASVAAAPLLVSRRHRDRVGLVAAASVTLFALVSGATVGFFFVPLVLVQWAAVLVPRALSRGFDLRSRPLWRVVLAVVLALPGVLLTAGMLSGAVAADWGGAGLGAVVLAVAGLVAAGLRPAFIVVAVLGALGMIGTVVDPGLLLAATWLLGGLWLVLGLTGAALTGGSRTGA
ncbi:MAG: hypothetical protein QM619_15035 [Micropruina sp.]|uniref:HAAS signaling domain-containing protein n=1 Tax=Micropruina sp. TaxID=2737536 RepID=UPI0039E65840